MFIELTKVDEDDKFPFLVNIERVMYVDPLQNGECRLYMNVASDDGDPSTVDVAESYDYLKKTLTTKGDYNGDK